MDTYTGGIAGQLSGNIIDSYTTLEIEVLGNDKSFYNIFEDNEVYKLTLNDVEVKDNYLFGFLFFSFQN